MDIEDDPRWQALRKVLRDLGGKCGGDVFALDAWGNLWCSSESRPKPVLESIVETVELVAKDLKPSLARGGKIDRRVTRPTPGYLRSFSGVYLVFVTSGTLSSETEQWVRDALPRISSLTAQLPPPDGPGSAGNEGVGVA